MVSHGTRAIERTAGDGEDRTAKTLLRLFRGLAKQRSAALPLIGGDRWPASIKAMAKKANQAVHILDRLHILPRIRKARHEVRGAEGQQRKKDGYGRILPRARWLLWN